MNSFTLTAVGQLIRNPELVSNGEIKYTRFCLIGNDFAGKNEDGTSREVVTTVWFVAFGLLGERLGRDALKGDQLIIEARVRSNNWIDANGEKQYDLSYIVQGFRFGAPGRLKREERELQRAAESQAAEESILSSRILTHAEELAAGSQVRSDALVDVADPVASEMESSGAATAISYGVRDKGAESSASSGVEPPVKDGGRSKATASSASAAHGPRTKLAVGRSRKAASSP